MMSRVQPALQNWSNLKDQTLSLVKRPEWTDQERTLVRDFLDHAVGADFGRVVHAYMKLVGDLAASTGLDRALVLAEGGRLIDHVDPTAYSGVAPGEVLDPVEFVQRRQGNATARKRLETWVRDTPLRLQAIKAQIIQAPSATLYDFPNALLEVVRTASKSAAIPSGVKAVCDAIRLGKTSIVRVDPPGLIAFHWPISSDDFPDLLTAKEAVRYLETLGKPFKERSLYSRAQLLPSLKQGHLYVKAKLQQASVDGVFNQGWKPS